MGSAGYFKAGLDSRGPPSFDPVCRRPTSTGLLHMGHGFNHTIMDALTRYHRMADFNTLWLRATDPPGSPRRCVVERQLRGQRRRSPHHGREAFIKQVWTGRKYSGGTILNQMRRLGDSVDWTRTYFTMDENLSKVVTETFVQLYEQGLIYRGKRLVNWDPKLQTAVSDLEVETRKRTAGCGRSATRRGRWHRGRRGDDTPGDDAGRCCGRGASEDERYASLVGRQLVLRSAAARSRSSRCLCRSRVRHRPA